MARPQTVIELAIHEQSPPYEIITSSHLCKVETVTFIFHAYFNYKISVEKIWAIATCCMIRKFNESVICTPFHLNSDLE